MVYPFLILGVGQPSALATHNNCYVESAKALSRSSQGWHIKVGDQDRTWLF